MAELSTGQHAYELESLQVVCGTISTPTATVSLRTPDGKTQVKAATGNGPVDATYKAIDAIVKAPSSLQDFTVHSTTQGRSALGHVTVTVENKSGQRTYGGHGTDSDIIVASAKAYIAALNAMLVAEPQETVTHGTMEDLGVMLVG
jgi:2-isopropylmalate synthase